MKKKERKFTLTVVWHCKRTNVHERRNIFFSHKRMIWFVSLR